MNDIKFAPSYDMTLENWLEYWFEMYAKRNVKRSTAVSYRGYITNHISPQIGLFKLSELNTDTLQRFFNYEYDSGNCKGGGLSAKTIRNIKLMLHKTLQKAVELELIKRNYIDGVELPKVYTPEMRVLTIAEQQRFTAALASDNDNKILFGAWLSLRTGMRMGEVLGLQWGDIDFGKNEIHIRRTVNRLQTIDDSEKRTEIVIGLPKSVKSIRNIPFNAAMSDVLLEYKEKWQEDMSVKLAAEDYVVTKIRGKPTEPKTMQKYLNRAMKEANISGATFHSLRHTFATRAIEKNVDVKTLSVLLGHADVGTTLNRYAHVLDEQKRKTMDILLEDM